jgi:hypothetical protein
MPVLPKSLLILGASVQTALVARRLRHKRSIEPQQEKALRNLLPRFAATSFGRNAGMTYPQFKARVPVRDYERFTSYIERMKQGEADVLWPGQCSNYAVSAGTTASRAKWLPVTGEMLDHFQKAGLNSLLFYTARAGHAGVCRGRHLFLGGSASLTPIPESRPFAAYGGDLSGIAALNLPPSVERHYYEPGAAIAQIDDWPARLAAIAQKTRRLDITLLAGIPNWLLILADILLASGSRGLAQYANLKAIWPNLECLVHCGAPVAPFHDELRKIVGPAVSFHEVYPASEGFIAAQDAESAAGLRLMGDTGLFFEFLPLREYDETLPASIGGKAVPIGGVKTGVDYVLLLTTPAGLCRYVIGDVVRFISTEPARLIYVGRTQLQLNAFGEHVNEKQLTDSITAVCQRHGWTIVNFHVAPMFASQLTGKTRGRHEWWIELKPGSIENPTGPILSPELDTELVAHNPDYAAKRKAGGLEAPLVRLVMPGLFEHWMRYHGKWGGQHKMPRCRNDREIADILADLARFYAG